jgi:uncharacterized protein
MDRSTRLHEAMRARLLVSVSGICDETLDDCARFCAELAARGVPPSLLVAPRPPGGSGLRCSSGWVAGQRDAGAAVLLHGYDHSAPPGASWIGGRRAEFAALPAHEAGLRLTAAVATLERHGLRTDLFAPPRWLASPGTLVALRRRGFVLCATAGAVRDLRAGVAHRGRVFGFGYGHGGATEPWRCRAAVLGTAGLARRGGLLRIAVDAADLLRDGPRHAAVDAVDIALHHGAVALTYRALARGRGHVVAETAGNATAGP